MTNLSTLFPAAVTYMPAMMKYDGSTTYYKKTNLSYTGNDITCTFRIKVSSFLNADNSEVRPYGMMGENISFWRILFRIWASDYATTELQNKMTVYVQNSSGTQIVNLLTSVDIADGNEHVIFFSFDGDTGAVTLIVDGADADDSGYSNRSVSTGTLAGGSSSLNFMVVGASGDGSKCVDGAIGFIGYDEQYLTNWSDFMDSNGNPIKQDESTWANSGWGSQPRFWNEHGFMEDNKGSAGDMTKNGTIDIAAA